MEDDKDKLTITEEGTPSSHPTEQKPTVSEEEQEWSSLKGTTQDRVRQVVQEKNEYKAKLSSMEEKLKELEGKISTATTTVPPAPTVDGELSPEQQKAIATLEKFGIVTEKKLQAYKDSILIENTYKELEGKYSGEDGKPAFNRSAIEKHMQSTGIYNPEKAYEDLYKEELFDLKMKERTSGGQSYTARPSGVGGQRGGEQLTAKSLAERLRKPDGRQWWEKNRNKILPVVGELIR